MDGIDVALFIYIVILGFGSVLDSRRVDRLEARIEELDGNGPAMGYRERNSAAIELCKESGACIANDACTTKCLSVKVL